MIEVTTCPNCKEELYVGIESYTDCGDLCLEPYEPTKEELNTKGIVENYSIVKEVNSNFHCSNCNSCLEIDTTTNYITTNIK